MTNGGAFRVDTYDRQRIYQLAPSVSALANGDYVVVWNDSAVYGANGGFVDAQIYDANGTPIGSRFIASNPQQGHSGSSDVAALSNGGFVVSWAHVNSGGQGVDIEAERFDASGNKVGSPRIVTTPAGGTVTDTAVAGLASGGFVVTWSYQGVGSGSSSAIEAQVYSAAGAKVGAEFSINTPAVSATHQAITALTGGGFLVSWTDAAAGHRTAIDAQMFDAQGAKVGGEIHVSAQPERYEVDSAITTLANGGFVLSWTDNGRTADGSKGSHIEAQVFDAAGAKVGAAFQVDNGGSATNTASSIAALDGGGFEVSWSFAPNGYSRGIAAQVFDSQGAKVGGQLLVQTPTPTFSFFSETPDIAGLAHGGAVVAWDQVELYPGNYYSFGIEGRFYDPAKPVPFDSLSNTFDYNGKNPSDYTGPFDYAQAGDDVVSLPSTASGIAAWSLKNGFYAGEGDDTVIAGAAPVTVFGEAGDDTLIGGGGDDRLDGGEGDDVIVGGAGRDMLYTGGGHNVFRFLAASDSGIGAGHSDQIRDFYHGADKIDLTPIVGNDFAIVDHFTGHADEVRLDHFHGGYWTTVSVDVDGDKRTDMQIMVGASFYQQDYTFTMADFVHV